jgi:hypothetical protein
MKVLKYIAAMMLGAVMLTATGCLADAEFDKNEPEEVTDGYITVEFTASQSADSETVVATRAFTADEENWLATVDVLVFDATTEMFLYSTHGSDIANTASSPDKTFKVMLRTDDGENTLIGKNLQMVVLGNLRSEWDAIKNSVTASTAISTLYDDLLKFDATGAWNTTTAKRYLPMTGQTGVFAIAAGLTQYATPIVLTRSVSSFDVGFGYGTGTTPQGLNNFKLKQVNAYGSPESGFASGMKNFSDPATPHIPADVELATTVTEYPLAAASATGMFNTIYTPEFEGDVDDFFLVIGGYYTAPNATENTTTLSWYKINWSTPETPITEYEARRNYKYTIQIEEIKGAGYASAAEAAAEETDSELLNLNIIPWDLSRTTTTVEGDYYFTVSKTSLELSRDERLDDGLGDNTLTLDTNYAGGWTVDGITNEGAAGQMWLTTDITSGAAGQTELVILTTDNREANSRIGYITLSAGRWKHTVTVTQLTTSEYTISVSPATRTVGAMGGTVTFAITTNIPGSPRISNNGYSNVGFTPSLSEDGRTLTVEVDANPNSYTRSGYFTLYAGSAYADVSISQATPGVRAVPGVIGYFATGDRKGELTLAGDDGDDTNGIVYVAYFKSGSLIAMSSENAGSFTSGDIVAVPEKTDGGFPYTLEEYRATVTGSSYTAWNMVKDAGDAGISLSKGSNVTQLLGDNYVADGLGDPCVQYFTDYRLPTSAENNRFVGGPATGTTNEVYWKEGWAPGGDYYYHDPQNSNSSSYGVYDYYNHGGATHAGNATDPNTGSFPVVANETDYPGVAAFSTVLPAAGYREYTYGNVTNQGTAGHYLSSTTYNTSRVHGLFFSESTLNPSYHTGAYYAYGYAVRCVLPPPTVTVSPTSATFVTAGETKTFTVTTTNFTGTPTVTKNGDSSDTSAAWITTASISGNTLTVTTAANSSTSTRTATITLTATNGGGTATATVTVIQAPTPATVEALPTTDFLSTVGAFWKSSQTGERIVTIPTTTSTYAGAWTAQVVYYGTGFTAGDILMVAGDSEDATSIAANTYTNPENRQASDYSGAAQAIAGMATTTSGVKFRIFMSATWDGTSPRYAKIAVNFGSTGQYTRFIYVRQGEQDDYLMAPGDAGTGVGTRDLAAKFSPYNLTDPDFTGLTGSTAQRGSTVTPQPNGDVFTDYPSQAGAFYKWAETAGVVAYNPAQPTSGAVTSWVSSNNVTANWDVEIGTTGNTPRDLYEGCPTGYRRPTDGSTSSDVVIADQGASNSEFGQSLYQNPASSSSNNVTNSVWGYYSDGWFDRFTPGQQAASSSYPGEANAAVSRDNSTVAYLGRLFYNPVAASANYNASLFFPAPGYRYNSYGYLYYPGTNGYYWSSSATSGSNGVYLYVYSSLAYRNNSTRHYGFSVRCVVAE